MRLLISQDGRTSYNVASIEYLHVTSDNQIAIQRLGTNEKWENIGQYSSESSTKKAYKAIIMGITRAGDDGYIVVPDESKL